MKLRIAEVSYDDGIDEYEVVAEDNTRARDLLVLHLQNTTSAGGKVYASETRRRKWREMRVSYANSGRLI